MPVVVSRAWLAWSLAELGEFEEGMAVGADAIQMAEAAGHHTLSSPPVTVLAFSTRPRSVGPPPPRRGRGAAHSLRGRIGRSPLPPGPHPSQGTRHAPAAGPLPPGPWHAICRDRPAGAGPCRADRRHHAVPCHGHDLLVPPGRSRTRLEMCVYKPLSVKSFYGI